MYLYFSMPFSLSFALKLLCKLSLLRPRFSSKKYTAVFCLVTRCSFTMVGNGFTHSEKLFLANTIRSTILQLSEIIILLFTSTNLVHAILNKLPRNSQLGKTTDRLSDFEPIFGPKIARSNFKYHLAAMMCSGLPFRRGQMRADIFELPKCAKELRS